MTDPRTRSAIRALPLPLAVRKGFRRFCEDRRRRQVRRLERRKAGPTLLRLFATTYPTAFFIEIGANDGDQHDHLRPILDTRPWRGIMVEPVPYVFARLRANYNSRAQVTLENVAIADRDGHLPFYHLRQASQPAVGLPRWYDGIGSFSRDAVLSHAALIPDFEQRLRCVQIPCLTFESLCTKHMVDKVDVLIVDVEGYDHEILRHVDWERHRPRLVVFEHYHLDAEDRDLLRGELFELGYELLEEGFDTWCLHTDSDPQLLRAFRALSPVIPSASVHEDR